VTDGIESAVKQAKAAAAGKSVGVHGADTIQQLLNAGLLDEIHVDVAAVLLGSGVRLFDHLAGTPAVLGNPTVIRASALHTCATRAQGVVLLAFAAQPHYPSADTSTGREGKSGLC
jgi:dihydrofolate reductase